ncbi:hypothetical protein OG767_18135 [Micromonospora sp. NBC_01392]|uniref:hypothetical protein n=1 Tax=Micromonospora sp. NBC_01392 TaxID=2903588 RepID=UPI0032445F3B
MRPHRSDGPADRAESDRLLDAVHAVPPADADPLTRLLAAAAAPATAGELDGEERALAAFRAARAAPAVAAPVPASRPRRRLRVAAALSGLAATAVAGVAFAAVRLDRSPQPVVPPAPTTAGPAPTAAGPSRSTPAGPSGAASGAASSPGTPSGSRPAAPPSVGGALVGHCRAWLAKPEPQRARALTTPGFADLVAAAGGPDRVESYCRTLVPAASPKTPAGKPSPKTPADPTPKKPADDTRKPGAGDQDDDED